MLATKELTENKEEKYLREELDQVEIAFSERLDNDDNPLSGNELYKESMNVLDKILMNWSVLTNE